MSGDRYARLQMIFEEARGLDANAREECLDRTCGDDDELRAEAERLLRMDAQDSGVDAFSESKIAASRGQLEAMLDSGETSSAKHVAAIRGARPERVGDYRIVRRIGEGGMGVVYEAEQVSPRRRVALKLIPAHRATVDGLRRFRQEAELIGRLHHPGIAQIYEAGTFDLGDGEQPFFAMEFIDGVDLRSHAEQAHLGVKHRLSLIAEVADAVHHAHDNGVIHRDLKPDNVLVDEHGRPKVLDFGVARAGDTSTAISTVMTQTGQVIGTLAYMAPEQLSADPERVTRRADVYSLGVMLFELLSGRLPHAIAGLPTTVAIRLLAEADAPRLRRVEPDLASDIETIAGKALEKEPARRYDSAAEFAADIRRYLDDLPIVARPPTWTYVARKFTRRHRTLVGGVAATIVTLLAGIVVSLILAKVATEQRDLAREREAEAKRNEARAVGATLEATGALARADDLWGAWEQHQLVPEHARGWAWEMVGRTLPQAIGPTRRHGESPWRFLDEDRLFRGAEIEDRCYLYDLVTRECRVLFEGEGFDQAGPHRSGFATARRGLDMFLLDVDSERILDSWSISRRIGGSLVASGDPSLRVIPTDPGTIDIVSGGEVVRTVKGIEDLTAIFFSPGGDLLAFEFEDHTRLEETMSGDVVYEAEGHRLSPFDGGFFMHRRDGYRLRRVDRTPEGLVFYDVDISSERPDDGDRPHDGRYCAMTGADVGPSPVLRDTRTGRPYLASRYQDEDGYIRFAARRLAGIQTSPGGTRVVLNGSYSRPWVIDVDPREREPDFDPRGLVLRGHTSWIYHVAISNDGSLIASAAPRDPLLRLWDTNTGECVATLQRRTSDHRSWDALMAFAEDDERLLVTTPFGEHEMALVEWNFVTGEIDAVPQDAAAARFRHLPMLDAFIDRLDAGPRARLSQRVQMYDDRAFVVATNASGMQERVPREFVEGGKRWRIAPGQDVAEHSPRGLAIHPRKPHVALVRSVSLDADDRILTQIDRGTLVVRHAETGAELERLDLEHTPWCAAYSPDGSLLAVGTHEGDIVLIDAEYYTPRFIIEASDAAESRYIYSVAWTPDGTRLVSVSGDGLVRIFDGRHAALSKFEERRWRALRAEMAQRDDPPSAMPSLEGEARAAARIEEIRRRTARGSLGAE